MSRMSVAITYLTMCILLQFLCSPYVFDEGQLFQFGDKGGIRRYGELRIGFDDVRAFTGIYMKIYKTLTRFAK